MAWPPTLEELKLDRKSRGDDADSTDDAQLQPNLDAAVAFVERVRPGFNYAAAPTSPYPAPSADLILGTLRLASRWKTRTRSADGLIDMGDMGAGRVPSFDADIDRLLGIGRFAGPVFA